MKKVTSLILIIGLLMMVFMGCGASQEPAETEDTAKEEATKAEEPKAEEPEKFLVGFSNLAVSDVFCKLRQDCFAALADKDNSLEVIYSDANVDINKQLDHVDNFIAQKVDAIILMPVDYAGIVPGIKKANEKGIPVICLGIESESGEYTFVGSKNYDAGVMQGEFMKENLPENAKVLYLEGTPGLYHSVERWEGFKAACLDQRTDLELLAKQNGNYERAKGMQIAEDWIQTFPEFDAIVAANDQMALGALEALKGANRLEGVLISGVDGTYDACMAIKNGEMAQSVFQNAPGQAEKCYETLKDILAGKSVPEFVDVPFESIVKDNVDQYLEEYYSGNN